MPFGFDFKFFQFAVQVFNFQFGVVAEVFNVMFGRKVAVDNGNQGFCLCLRLPLGKPGFFEFVGVRQCVEHREIIA